jgi:endonuclease-3
MPQVASSGTHEHEWPRGRAHATFEALAERYGVPDWSVVRDDALAEVVQTILSQHTSDLNSARAYAALKQRFPSWESVLQAGPAALSDAIRAGGLAEVKARYILAALEAVQADRGELDLEFLREVPYEQARSYLRALPGVGPKTAACVQAFALQQPALPVDTHVHRVSRRLGLIPPAMGADPAHVALERQVPPSLRYAFHVLLIRHGRGTCKATRPLCELCPLADSCPRVGVADEPVRTLGGTVMRSPASGRRRRRQTAPDRRAELE